MDIDDFNFLGFIFIRVGGILGDLIIGCCLGRLDPINMLKYDLSMFRND